MTLPRSLSLLKRHKEAIEREGYLSDCWIERYRPRGTAKGNQVYYQLRSRTPFANGARRRHLKPEEVAIFRRLVENGRTLKKLEREIAYLQGEKLSRRAVITSSASDEWYTPPEYVELARMVMGGIDLDPASNDTAQAWIQAATYYTQKENGLEKPWCGRLWLNPPYGTQVGLWTRKAIQMWDRREVSQAVMLMRPSPGSSWFQELSSRFPCCIPHKRIRFIDAKGQAQASPVHGNAFFYLGENIERFREVFSDTGVVTRPF
jgi:hypothetical protein